VFSNADHYVVRLEVPGIAPKDLNIESQGSTLTISGNRRSAAPEQGAYHRRERSTGEFSRSIRLPNDLDLQRAEATCRHGHPLDPDSQARRGQAAPDRGACGMTGSEIP